MVFGQGGTLGECSENRVVFEFWRSADRLRIPRIDDRMSHDEWRIYAVVATLRSTLLTVIERPTCPRWVKKKLGFRYRPSLGWARWMVVDVENRHKFWFL